MSIEKITLHVGKDFVSVFAMSAYVALMEKGLPFEIRTVDLKAKEQMSPQYRELSLTCKVPTLVYGEFRLSESSAIAEFLEELFPAPAYRPLFPLEIRRRARARQIQAWLRSDLQVLRSERPADLFYGAGEARPLSEAARAAADKLLHVAQSLLGPGQPYLFDEWCSADADLAVMLNRLVFNKDPVPASLQAYVEQQWNRDSLLQWRKQNRD